MKDPRNIDPLGVIQRWLDGKATGKEVKDAADTSFSYDISYASFSASNAALIAYSDYCAANPDAADYAAYATASCTYASMASGKDYTPKLLEMIEELTPLEKMLYEK